MTYWEVTVIAAGALDEIQTFSTNAEVDEFVDKIRMEDEGTEYVPKLDVPVEVYIEWHDHDESVEMCCCAQMDTNGNPDWTFGPDWEDYLKPDIPVQRKPSQDDLDIERMTYEMA